MNEGICDRTLNSMLLMLISTKMKSDMNETDGTLIPKPTEAIRPHEAEGISIICDKPLNSLWL